MNTPFRALLATVLFALVAVPVGAQTLAEAAAEAAKIKHTWPTSMATGPTTFGTAPPVTPATTDGETVSVAPVDTATTTTEDDTTKGVQTPAYWHARLAAVEPRVVAMKKSAASAAATVQQQRRQIAGQTTDSGRALYAQGLKTATATQDAIAAKLAEAQAAVTAVHEDARLRGVLPGWLR